MPKNTGFAVVGVRNFADTHINNLRRLEKKSGIKLAAVVIRDQVSNIQKTRELRSQGIKVFDSYRQLLRDGRNIVDVVSLPVSIPTHSNMAIKGMEAGFDVLLEKPPAPTVEEVDRMIETEQRTGRFCSIGFQFIHSRSIRRLKEMIMEGKLGEIKEIATKGYWPRYRSYYERNRWAGRSILNGQLVLDGPMFNAFAHYLNNMLFLASAEENNMAELREVRAELYRGHSYIESDDTSCLQAIAEDGTKIYFYVNHTSRHSQDPYMEVIGEKGKAIWHKNEQTEVQLEGGDRLEFDNEGLDPWLEVFRVTAAVKNGELEEPYCTPCNCRNFVVAINGAYQSSKTITPIPGEFVNEFETEDGRFKTEVKDIEAIMDEAFESRKLLSETEVEWGEPTESVNVKDFKHFQPFVTG